MSVVGKNAGDKPAARGPRVNWLLLQIWFLRLLALGWMVKGLMAWAAILGVEYLDFRPFETQPVSFQTVTIYFAVIDLVAAVGLWLLASWGGVVWLIAVASRLVLGFVFPGVTPVAPWAAASLGVSIVVFLLLTWLAERSRDA